VKKWLKRKELLADGRKDSPKLKGVGVGLGPWVSGKDEAPDDKGWMAKKKGGGNLEEQ